MAVIVGKKISDFTKLKELPVFTVLTGAHLFDHDVAMDHCKKLFLEKYAKDGEISYPDANAGITSVLSELGDCGFFQSSRLAIVRVDSVKPLNAAELLNRWLPGCPQETFLVLSVPSLKSNAKFLKELDDTASVFNFPQLARWDYPDRANALIGSSGLKFDRDPQDMLVNAFEGDLIGLRTELEKIKTWLGDRRTVRKADLEEISTAHVSVNKFELVDHIIGRRSSQALDLLERVMREGEQPQVFLATVLTEMRKVYLAAEMLKNRVSEQEIADKLKVKFRTHEFLAKARAFRDNFNPERVLEILVTADRAMKTSVKPPEMILQESISKLIS